MSKPSNTYKSALCMIEKKCLFLLVMLITAHSVSAELKVKLGGRLFFDGGTFVNAPDDFHTTFGLPEIRLAGKVTFDQGFYVKIEAGLAKNKLVMKDVFMQKSWSDHFLRAGYQLGLFSIDQYVSTNDYTFNTGTNVAETFYPDRRLGLLYAFKPTKHHLSVGLFGGDGLNELSTVVPGINSTVRYVIRPVDRDQQLLHLGAGAFYRIPDMNKETGLRPVQFATKGVTYLSVGEVVSLSVPDAKNVTQYNTELLYQHTRWTAKAEYYGMTIRTANDKSFYVQGGNIDVGYLIRGEKHGYDYLDAMPIRPTDPHSIMIVSRLNCTNLNNTAIAGGGKQWDLALGLNYYYNMHFCAKLNYTQLWTDENTQVGKRSFGMLQARLQVSF